MNSIIINRFKQFIPLIICLIFFIRIEQVTSSLKFELSTDHPRCFYEELYGGYVMMIKWKISGVEESNEGKINQFLSMIQISISRENTLEIVKREYLKSITGKLSFNSETDDTYKICVSYHGGWTIPYPALVGIKISSDNMDHPDLKRAVKNSDLDSLDKMAGDIIDHAKEYKDQQKHEMDKEDKFAKDHITFSKTFYYVTVFQLVIIVVLGLYQVFSFKKFLVSNNAI
jgi:hypothetical protein